MTTPPQYRRNTNADLLEHQHNSVLHHYDHTHPTDIETDVAWTLLEQAETSEQILVARSYGESKGVWYWHQPISQWVNPPKKAWRNV